MNSLSFKPNSTFLLHGERYRIDAVLRTDKKTTVSVLGPDGVVTIKSLDYLLHEYEMGNLRADATPARAHTPAQKSSLAHALAADLPKADLEVGRRRWKLICAIDREGGFLRGNVEFWRSGLQALCAELQFNVRPSRTTITRWLKRLGKAPDVPPEIVLTPMNRLKGGRGRTRLSDDALAITDRCLEDIYLSNPGASLRHCHLELVARIKVENDHRDVSDKLKLPSYQQLRRHVQGMSAYKICASRHGRAVADSEFRSTKYLKRNLTRALQRVEVDHTPLDVFAVDSNNALLGRARLTLVLDVATRSILGFSVGHDGNSAVAVLDALRHAVSPKTYLKTRYPAIVNEWPMHGVFELLAMDNGPEFHAAGFIATVKELCISADLAYMPRRKAYFKGTVEAIQKYLNRDMSDLQPGATQSHHWQRNKERPPEQYAVHTLESMTELLHTWICDIYHPRIHSDLRASPLATWREKVSMKPVRLPRSAEMLELACTELVQRRVQPYGVEIYEIRSFNCDQLQNIRRLHQHRGTVTVDVRFKPRLLDRIWVKDPDSLAWFEIRNDDWQTRDKSLFQVQTMNRIAREAANEEGLVVSLADAYRRMTAIGNELRSAKTIAKRLRALKLLGLAPSIQVGEALPAAPSSAPIPPVPAPKTRSGHRSSSRKLVVHAAQHEQSRAPDTPVPVVDPAARPSPVVAIAPFRIISSLVKGRPA